MFFLGLIGRPLAVLAFILLIAAVISPGARAASQGDGDGASSRPLPDLAYHEAPVSLDTCMDASGLVLARPDQRATGLTIGLHANSPLSLRRKSWSDLGLAPDVAPDDGAPTNAARQHDEAAPADWTIRGQIEIRLQVEAPGAGADAQQLVPLLYRPDPAGYIPACTEEDGRAARPQDYPTVHLTLRPSAHDHLVAPEDRSRSALITRLRESKHNLFVPAENSPEDSLFSWEYLESIDERLTYGTLLARLLPEATPAFLKGWPGRVEVTLDGVAARPDLAAIRLMHEGAPPDEAGRAHDLSVVLPPVLAHVVEPDWLKETGDRCPGPWRPRPGDDRILTTRCSGPPPYDLRIGQARPVTVEGSALLVDPETLVIDLKVPLPPEWAGNARPDRTVSLGAVRASDLLAGRVNLPMFPKADEDTAVATSCRVALKPDPGLINGAVPSPPAPTCRVIPLPAPAAWRPTVTTGPGPKVLGCLAGSPPGLCVLPSDREADLALDWGLGWQRLPLDDSGGIVTDIWDRLRPRWPYDGWTPVRGADGRTVSEIRLAEVRYCQDVQARDCCKGKTRPKIDPDSGGPLLPTLAEAGCGADALLPVFGVATFATPSTAPGETRFHRYWVIGHRVDRPVTLARDEVLPLLPVDARTTLSALDPGARIAIFGSLRACREVSDPTLAAALLEADQPALSISLPAFARYLGAADDGACVEASIKGGETPQIVFRFPTDSPPTEAPDSTSRLSGSDHHPDAAPARDTSTVDPET